MGTRMGRCWGWCLIRLPHDSLNMSRLDLSTTSPRLVWSGPQSDPNRNTRLVLEDLLASAKHSIWVSSFVAQTRRRVLGQLALHMDAKPRLRTHLILNVPRYKRDDRTNRRIVREFDERFWKRWPGKRRPCVYYDPRPVRRQGRGQLHAKLVVADAERVFITSANMTRAAWDDNIELGVLIHDRALADECIAHLRDLITREHLVRLPGSRPALVQKTDSPLQRLIGRLRRPFAE